MSLMEKAEKDFFRIVTGVDPGVRRVMQAYEDISDKYDQMIEGLQHKKFAAVDELESVVMDKNARILDLGAGTGIIGQYLSDRGYKNVVALEPSQGMVNEAKKKNVYKEFVMEMIGKEESSMKSESFDAVLAVGVVTINQVTLDAFPEILRVTKQGGVIVFLGPKPVLHEHYEETIDHLEGERKWKVLKVKTVEEYFKGQDALLHVLQKL